MSKGDTGSKLPNPPLQSPLNEFSDHGLLKFDPETDHHKLIDTTNSALASEHYNPTASEFLSVEAELLTLSKKFTTSTSFEGLVLKSTPLYQDRIRIDCYDATNQTIYICPNEMELLLGPLFVHEMTHAIDDIYDDRKSGDRVLDTLRFKANGDSTSRDFQKHAIDLVCNTLPLNIETIFKNSYCKIATQNIVSFTSACESAERKARDSSPGVLTRQEKAASVVLGEFAAFTFEALFSELQQDPSAPSKFLQNYSRLNPTASVTIASERHSTRLAARSLAVPALNEEQELKSTAQEVIAVSIFEITKHMIDHIEATQVKSTGTELKVNTEAEEKIASLPSEGIISSPKSEAREVLLDRLKEVQAAITPAHDRAQEKIAHYNTSHALTTDSKAAPEGSPSKKTRTRSSRIHDLDITRLVENMRGRSKSVDSLPSILSPASGMSNFQRRKSEPSLQH
jgi:hypothetical protein